MNESTDYRNSHTAKGYGVKYHDLFNDNPYRKYIWGVEKDILDKIVQKYFTRGIESHLDFACGTGRILSYLEKNATKSTGLDISVSMLEVAKAGCKKSALIKGDITNKKILEDKRFNLITAFRFFLNAQPSLRTSVMKELKLRLRPDGFLVFNIHNNTSGLTNQISKVYTTIKYRKRIPRNEMSVAQVNELIEENGMEIVEKISYGSYPVFKEEKAINEKFIRLFDKYFCNTILSTYIIYVCRLK